MVQFTVTDRVIDSKTLKFLPRHDDRPASATESAPLPPQSPERGSNGDSVTLSDDAKALMEQAKATARGQFTLTTGELETRIPGFDSRKFTPAYKNAEQDYMERMRAYNTERETFFEEKLGMKVGLIGGAAFGVLDRLAAHQGILKPPVPDALLEAGWSDPFEADKDSPTGVLGIGIPGTDRSLTITFDRTASIPPDAKLKLAGLTQDGSDNGPLLGRIRTGALGKLTNWDAAAGNTVHAVTDGTKGPNAKVLATISSHGMDDEARQHALSLLGVLRNFMEAP
ncbi:hypothetical protein MCW82_09510 [Azospirillum doebereinerae]|uniref:hypothetical protein n=1 Tax=Azospirillum doebereinerae TaxID=92933 RepID=UPI001EE5D3C1|nr:hypothetical protein [Azospirillum doebereinerae]MCG5240001.1 hypothetical protein [Azospirillum doebereinerae]